MKTILLHAGADAGFEARLQAALDLARAFGGHVRALSITPYSAYMLSDPYGGTFVVQEMMDGITARQAEHKAQIEGRLAAEDVPFDYVQAAGDTAEVLVSHSLLADVLVLSRPVEQKRRESDLPLVADVAIHAGAPVLAVPPGTTRLALDSPVLIAWNAKAEAAAAVKAALPLLRNAPAVHVLHVAEPSADLPPTAVCAYLDRHGIRCEMIERPQTGAGIEAVILDEARTRGAGLIAAGAYGHSRAREWLIGGVSRDLLLDAPLPLLMAH